MGAPRSGECDATDAWRARAEAAERRVLVLEKQLADAHESAAGVHRDFLKVAGERDAASQRAAEAEARLAGVRRSGPSRS